MTINQLLGPSAGAQTCWAAGGTAANEAGETDFFALLAGGEPTTDETAVAEPVETEATPLRELPPLTFRHPATLLSEFQQLLQQRLADAGLSASPPVQIASDTSGHLQVSGDRPDVAEIESLLNGDRELRSAYKQWEVGQEMQAALDRHMEFVKAYERDPVAAAKLLPLPQGQPFSLQIDGDAVEIIGG